MLSHPAIADLLDSPRRDVLSIALDVDPTKPENQNEPPAYRIWLRNELRALLDHLDNDVRKRIKGAADRVEAFVERERPQGRGLAIFAADELWRVHVLPVPLKNVVRFGRPDVLPLLWAADEYEPYAVLAVSRERALLLIAYLGGTMVAQSDVLELDTRHWRFKSGRPPTFTKGMGTGASRGTERDTFEARIEDHLRRLWSGAAEAADRWLQEARVERLIIAGPDEAASAVRNLLPAGARAKLVAVVPIPADADPDEIHRLTMRVALDEEHRRERALVEDLLARAPAGVGTIVGVEPTLEALAREQVITLVVDRNVDGQVYRCTKCGFVTAKVRPGCPVCGGQQEPTELTQVLPLLARQNGARVEIVGGETAAQLRAHGGVGAILRYIVPS
ncbi:MAG: VLRF1 family aeRF1-type release factor [bacterium]